MSENKGEQQPTEVSASSVRSSLATLEMQTSNILTKLEDVKLNHQATPGPVFNYQSLTNFLNGDKKTLAEVFNSLEQLIFAADDEEEENDYLLPPLDENSHLALVSHSIIAYLSHLPRNQLILVSNKIYSETTKWINNMFRFIDSSAIYHNNAVDCLTKAIRLALFNKFPNYLEHGVQELPKLSIYLSESSSLSSLQFACRQIGLPMSSIKVIPCNSVYGASESIDASALQKAVSADDQVPLFLVTDMGASFTGHVDNLMRLQEITSKHNIWLHLRGASLASLAITRGSGADIKKISDSMQLNLDSWLALPSISNVLLFRNIQNLATSGLFDADPTISRLQSLNLWSTLQNLGRDAISERFVNAFESCRIIYEMVAKSEGIRMLSKKPGGESGTTIADLVTKPVHVAVLFEAAVPTVVFQFDGGPEEEKNEPTTEPSNAEDIDPIVKKTIEKVTNSSYYDRLNSWLGQTLQRDFSQIQLEVVDHQIYGTCIRYCPFELSLGETVPSTEILGQFAEFFENQVDILKATVHQKAVFINLVEKSPVLRLVELAEWAGLGGVHYVPEIWETLLTDQAKTELNKLNTHLVDTLRTADNAFSLGEGADGLICVRFGMVTSDTDVEELLELVIQAGRSIQENSKILDTMSEIVKKGIEAATLDLQRENDEKIWQDGILRHVPVVGSFVNWWSPTSKETGIKGRSLNLTQGIVESTENIYKYHTTNSASMSKGIKNHPTPLVQTQVSPTGSVGEASAGHSRNESQSSATSNQVTIAQVNPAQS